MKTPKLPSSFPFNGNAFAQNYISVHLLLLLNRITVGWFFAAAGFRKASGEIANGLGAFYRGDGFQGRNPAWAPEFIIAPYGYALPWLELLFGGLLLLGLLGRISAGVLALLSFTIALALLGSGDLFPVHHVTVFFSLTLLLFFMGPGRYSLDDLLFQRRQEAAVLPEKPSKPETS